LLRPSARPIRPKKTESWRGLNDAVAAAANTARLQAARALSALAFHGLARSSYPDRWSLARLGDEPAELERHGECTRVRRLRLGGDGRPRGSVRVRASRVSSASLATTCSWRFRAGYGGTEIEMRHLASAVAQECGKHGRLTL
jgi:hypothetical protein